MPPSRRSRLVSSTTAAEALGVHPGTLWRWVKEGKVKPTAVTAGKHLRWDMADLRRQLALTDEESYVPEPSAAPERPAVVAAIVTSYRGVLAGRRRDKTPPWTFIAGEIEPGESQADAAVREVKEETGLEVRAAGLEISRRVHPYTGRLMIYLACSPVEGVEVHVGDEDELAEVRWLSLAEVDELMPTTYEPVREYLGMVIN